MRVPGITWLLLLVLLLPLPGADAYAVVQAGPDCAPEIVADASPTHASCAGNSIPDCTFVFVTIHEDPLWLEPSLKTGCANEWLWSVLELLP